MIKNSYPGKFIVLESIDYGGKGTQMTRLENYFKANHKSKVLMTFEPTDQYYGRRIREGLKDPEIFQKVPEHGFQTLYAVDSREHMVNRIIPALEDGVIVISDRYRISSMAYGARTVKEIDSIYAINKFVLGDLFIWPDLIVLIDISADLALQRKESAGREFDVFEQKQYLERVRSNYLHIANNLAYPNIQVVNGDGGVEEVFTKIRDLILSIKK